MLVRPEQVETALAKFGPDALYVPVVLARRLRDTTIPQFLARYYAEVTGADVARNSRQTMQCLSTRAPMLLGLLDRLARIRSAE